MSTDRASTASLLIDAAQCVLDPEGFDVGELSRQLQLRAGVFMGVVSADEEIEANLAAGSPQ